MPLLFKTGKKAKAAPPPQRWAIIKSTFYLIILIRFEVGIQRNLGFLLGTLTWEQRINFLN